MADSDVSQLVALASAEFGEVWRINSSKDSPRAEVAMAVSRPAMDSQPAQEVLVRGALSGEVWMPQTGPLLMPQTLKTLASAISHSLNVKDYRVTVNMVSSFE